MNELTLTNRALRNAKLDTIDSLDDLNDVAAYCRENMQDFIDEMLSEHDWGFARVRKSLIQTTVMFSDWDYAFDLPDDMIKKQTFVITDQNHRQYELTEEDYEVFNDDSSADGNSARVAFNREDIDIVYTKRITVVSRLPYYFANALAYLYAYYLGTAFGGAERAGWAYQMYSQKELQRAIGQDHDLKRKSIKGERELTGEPLVYDPWGFR